MNISIHLSFPTARRHPAAHYRLHSSMRVAKTGNLIKVECISLVNIKLLTHVYVINNHQSSIIH